MGSGRVWLVGRLWVVLYSLANPGTAGGVGRRALGTGDVIKLLSAAQSLSLPGCATPGTAALQAPLSMGFSRQEHWSGLPCPTPGDLPDPGIEPAVPALAADSLPLSLLGSLKML